jgi:hypothetical protein
MGESNKSFRPRARRDGLVVRELADEVLVYDLERHRAVCLNRAAAVVWRGCDGRTGIEGLTRRLSAELGEPVTADVVWLALDQLGSDRLLVERARRPGGASALTRRELIKRAGLAAAVALPVVTSIVAPTAAQAASCLPSGAACTSPAQCCSGLCPSTTCT